VPTAPGELGPIQLVVIASAGGTFDDQVLDQLRRLRAREEVRLIDLLFVAKGADGAVAEVQRSDLSGDGRVGSGALVRDLIGADAGDGAGEMSEARDAATVDREGVWFLADEIPAGSSAAIALLEHRWAVPLRDAIESAGAHELVDRWIHREDLPPIET
jgi:uncharacterized membrane protein